MTKEEFHGKLFTELEMQELINLNPRIYFNPAHIKYYEKYHLGEYNWCWNFLMEHRYILNEDFEIV